MLDETSDASREQATWYHALGSRMSLGCDLGGAGQQQKSTANPENRCLQLQPPASWSSRAPATLNVPIGQPRALSSPRAQALNTTAVSEGSEEFGEHIESLEEWWCRGDGYGSPPASQSSLRLACPAYCCSSAPPRLGVITRLPSHSVTFSGQPRRSPLPREHRVAVARIEHLGARPSRPRATPPFPFRHSHPLVPTPRHPLRYHEDYMNRPWSG